MIIETNIKQKNNKEVGCICIDDTLDLYVTKENNKYIITVLENNCVDYVFEETDKELE